MYRPGGKPGVRGWNVPHLMMLTSHHHPPAATIMELHSAIDHLDGRAPRSQMITYAPATMATSTTAKAFVSNARPVSSPVHPAVRAEVSPVRMWVTATVTSAPNRISRLSLLTLEPM